jgi:RimJ/RimL family protein N-acetyltransferase
VQDAEAFIAHVAKGDETAFAIALPDGRLIGNCGIGRLRADGPEIGYAIGVDHWGRGYATEAARAVIDHAFGDLGFEELKAGARVSNPASRRVIEKCGFQWTGVVLQRIRAIQSSAPCDRFRLDRTLWASLRNWGKVRLIA